MSTATTEIPCGADTDSCINRKQLAQRYGVSLRTVDEWMVRGWIPFLKLGKCIRFSLAEVQAALRERCEVRAKAGRR